MKDKGRRFVKIRFWSSRARLVFDAPAGSHCQWPGVALFASLGNLGERREIGRNLWLMAAILKQMLMGRKTGGTTSRPGKVAGFRQRHSVAHCANRTPLPAVWIRRRRDGGFSSVQIVPRPNGRSLWTDSRARSVPTSGCPLSIGRFGLTPQGNHNPILLEADRNGIPSSPSRSRLVS